MKDEQKYWAFISYSHADAKWAEWLHKSLERYKVPARLVGRQAAAGVVPKKMFPVFRDRDELAGSSELGGSLQAALRASRCQVVIASRNSARSRWVNEEIKYYKSLGRDSRVLALIVDGEPNASDKGDPASECFPEALRFKVDALGRLTSTPAEQVAADARKHADGKDNALLKLIAGILGVGYDELRQRELAARNRRLAIMAGLSTSVAAVTIVLAVLAIQARNDAQRRQQQAEDLLQFMVGDLRDKLEPIGKLSILDAVGKKAMDYFATLDASDVTDGSLASRARALGQIGDVRTKQGDMAGAQDAYSQGLALDEELARRHPREASYLARVGKSQFNVGYGHYLKGEWDAAKPWFDRYVATTNELLALEPGKDEWMHESVVALSVLGAVQYQVKNYGDARKTYESARDRQQKLLDRKPDDRESLASMGDIRSGLWGVAYATGELEKARAEAQAMAALRRAALAAAPEDANAKNALASANLLALYTESQLRPVTADAPALRETLAVTTELVALDPDNIEYARNRQIALNYLVDAHLTEDHVHAAEDVAEEVLDLARETFRRSPANAAALDDLIGIINQSAKLAMLQKDRQAALARVREVQSLKLTPEQVKATSTSRWLDVALLDWWLAGKSEHAAALKAEADAWLGKAQAAGGVKAEQMLRYAALSGNRAEAAQWLSKLSRLERAHPFVRQFCRDTGACGA